MLRCEKDKRPPRDKRTSADLAWQIVKLLHFESVSTLHYVKNKFKPSPTLLHMGMKYLNSHGYIVQNGDQIALSQRGEQFYDARKALLND